MSSDRLQGVFVEGYADGSSWLYRQEQVAVRNFEPVASRKRRFPCMWESGPLTFPGCFAVVS